MSKFYIPLILLAFISTGCSKYGNVRLKYPNDPVAYLPEGVDTIAIINRSLTKKEDKKGSVIESIATGEIAGSDKKASEECLKGVYDGINGWGDYSIVKPNIHNLYGTGSDDIPNALPWDLVQKICDSTNADALLVLEMFDSNSDVVITNAVNTIGAIANGGSIPPPVNRVRMNVVAYWRVYEPASKTIVDEFKSTNFMNFDLGGPLMLPPPDALPQTAYNTGSQYIERFLPSYYYVTREFYKRGKSYEKHLFLTAFRKSELADWKAASEIWSQLAESPNRKNAGRACLNMAVACEVLGQTDLALQWAKKAYEDYNNKLARDYANILRRRQNLE